MENHRRLNRLFAPDGRCFDLALDHGFFNEYGMLTGLEDMGAAVRTGIAIGVDAIQVAPGHVGFLQNARGRHKPSLVLRVDTANAYGRLRPSPMFSSLIGDPVEQALRFDAACVILNCFYIREQPELHRQCLRNLARVAGGRRALRHARHGGAAGHARAPPRKATLRWGIRRR